MPSISLRIVAPVVVKPDAVSKIQSAKFGISPEIQKGSAPNTDTISQAIAVVAMPSRAYTSFFSGFRMVITVPEISSPAAVTINANMLSGSR